MLTAISAIASITIATASALIAIFAVYIPRRDQHDQQLFQQAILALERAYGALTNNGQQITPPAPDRLNWLTSARHLLSYKSLKSRLKTKLYCALCEEHEEFWRHQFYLSLNMHKIHDPAYYDRGPPPELRPQIEPRSAIIIYSFASWPKSKVDPIDAVDIRTLLQESDPLKGNHGLREYIGKFPRITGET